MSEGPHCLLGLDLQRPMQLLPPYAELFSFQDVQSEGLVKVHCKLCECEFPVPTENRCYFAMARHALERHMKTLSSSVAEHYFAVVQRGSTNEPARNLNSPAPQDSGPDLQLLSKRPPSLEKDSGFPQSPINLLPQPPFQPQLQAPSTPQGLRLPVDCQLPSHGYLNTPTRDTIPAHMSNAFTPTPTGASFTPFALIPQISDPYAALTLSNQFGPALSFGSLGLPPTPISVKRGPLDLPRNPFQVRGNQFPTAIHMTTQDRSELDKDIAKMIVFCGLSLDFADSESFRRVLQLYAPYTPPSRERLVDTIMRLFAEQATQSGPESSNLRDMRSEGLLHPDVCELLACFEANAA